jgi:hypothetical protein
VADIRLVRISSRKAVILEEGAKDELQQEYLNGVLELPAIVNEFPTLLELTKLSVVHQQHCL